NNSQASRLDPKTKNRLGNWPPLGTEEIRRIEARVAEIESRTDGEIIPCVVQKSSPIESVGLKIFLLFLSLSPAVLLEAHFLGWGWDWRTWFSLFIHAVLSHFLGIWLSRFESIQRFFIRCGERRKWVHQRAELEFYRGRFHHTQKRTGILLFVSLMEHEVCVLADQGIARKLGPEVWNQVVDKMLPNLKSGNLEEAFLQGIDLCGDILREHFPSSGQNLNEISNRLVLDPALDEEPSFLESQGRTSR
ncbi:MAG: TPM domain-containing protein, partial [Bdellovibrio sp.]